LATFNAAWAAFHRARRWGGRGFLACFHALGRRSVGPRVDDTAVVAVELVTDALRHTRSGPRPHTGCSPSGLPVFSTDAFMFTDFVAL
jgi:hypothetical protein